MALGVSTYDSQGIHEDLLDLIADVSPDSNPLTTLFGTTTSKGTVHQWTEDYLSRPTTNTGEVEGSDATFADLTQPQRRTNITQIIRAPIRLTDSERQAAVAGMGDPYEYQQAKALRNWKNKLEFAVIRSTLSSGASGVAPTMAGIQAIVTSHYTNLLSGSSLSETHLNSMVLAVALDVGDDSVFDTLVTTLALRQKVSTFTAGNTKYVDASEQKLTRKVMVYESKRKIGLNKLSYMLETLKALHTDIISVIMEVNGQYIQLQLQGYNNRQSAGKTLCMVWRNTGRGGLVLYFYIISSAEQQKIDNTSSSSCCDVAQRNYRTLQENLRTYDGNKNDRKSKSSTKRILQTELCCEDGGKQTIGNIFTKDNSLSSYKTKTSKANARILPKSNGSREKKISGHSLFTKRNTIGKFSKSFEQSIENPQRLHAQLSSRRDDIVQTLFKYCESRGIDYLDFNVMRIFGHKDVYASAATPGPSVFGLKETSWKVAYYRNPQHIPLAKTGSSTKGMIEGEATLEFRAERSNAYSSGFALTG